MNESKPLRIYHWYPQCFAINNEPVSFEKIKSRISYKFLLLESFDRFTVFKKFLSKFSVNKLIERFFQRYFSSFFSIHLKFVFKLKECLKALGGYLYFANGSKWWYGRFLTIQNVANLILIDHWVQPLKTW